MALKETSNKLFILFQINWSGFTAIEQQQVETELQHYIHQFNREVAEETSLEVLQSIVEEEKKKLFLPTPCLIKLYQRYVTLSKSDQSVYLELVNSLKLSGPDWDEDADEIKHLVERHQFEEAYEIVRKMEA